MITEDEDSISAYASWNMCIAFMHGNERPSQLNGASYLSLSCRNSTYVFIALTYVILFVLWVRNLQHSAYGLTQGAMTLIAHRTKSVFSSHTHVKPSEHVSG